MSVILNRTNTALHKCQRISLFQLKYSLSFLIHKTQRELSVISFLLNNKKHYNASISFTELLHCLIHHIYNSASDLSNIFDVIIKNFHSSTILYLLLLFNNILTSSKNLQTLFLSSNLTKTFHFFVTSVL